MNPLSRIGLPRARFASIILASVGVVVATAGDAHAQASGNANTPLPNVLLLVDTSGSMERMSNSSLPSDNKAAGYTLPTNKCSPGTATNPNRWGMLLQALTGNIQPYYSCAEVSRAAGSDFVKEFSIGGVQPYDTDYSLPYHRPVSGQSAPTDSRCLFVPYKLPGVGSNGIGPGGYAAGGNAEDFPTDAFASVPYTFVNPYPASGIGLPTPTQTCLFQQAADGQLDATQDYVRFGLMTFDNDTGAGIGVSNGSPPSGAVLTGAQQPFLGQWSYISGGAAKQGAPNGCPTLSPFEVGARHQAAPPWEGRMVPFPDPLASLYDVERTNDRIQQVILGSRPYGATPIDGMLDDARDYLRTSTFGPLSGTGAYEDKYAKGGCRDEFIILLTDGAPNLDLRPQCNPNAGVPNGKCPFNQVASQVTADLYNNPPGSSKPITTYVIGFSVNGTGDGMFGANDGFPGALANKTCRDWYLAATPMGGGGTPGGMSAACTAAAPPTGSTADACCRLNDIAWNGNGGSGNASAVGPFFAESQADLVQAFSRILGSITQSATTRTVPGSSPVSNVAGLDTTATFIASFIPNARKVWSGEIDRQRNICSATGAPSPVAQSSTQGDSYSVDLAVQASNKKRFFVSAVGDDTGSYKDSARTMRPFSPNPAAAVDGIPAYEGQEVAALDDGILAAVGGSTWATALDIDGTTCKTSRTLGPGGTLVQVPRLSTPSECAQVIWDFATAHPGAVTPAGGGGFDYNIRCKSAVGVGNAGSGTCSISGTACLVDAPTCAVPGEVCVPTCAALGAVFRSSPVVAGPPDGFLRDDGYRNFQDKRQNRKPSLFVATTDGVLHAFQALATSNPAATNYELWAFVPPAVLPKLSSNYPGGQQILLDGTPAVKEVVWDRKKADVTASGNLNDWHTTLVAGMGAGGSGYYALNVSDVDCGASGACDSGGNAWQKPTKGAANLKDVSIGAVESADALTNGGKNGPHFLWQITDVEQDVSDITNVVRKSRDNKSFVPIFGKQSGTAAITTLQVIEGGEQHQIGVAILPGGIDGPPVQNKRCQRAVSGGYTGSLAGFKVSDSTHTERTYVRQWATSCTDPVAGRGVTIVRLDTGDIIAHFGRKTQDVPSRIRARTIDSPFDSPMIGAPVVYPNTLGASAQKIFIGDADGTIWRIDVSKPWDIKTAVSSTTPWEAVLFQDVLGGGIAVPDSVAGESQPLQVTPVISQTTGGTLIVNAATGDQENILYKNDTNYVISIEEQRPAGGAHGGTAAVRWWLPLTGSERVTGPMAVFDRVLYFASYKPAADSGTGGVCGTSSSAYLWGLDYVVPNASGANQGGFPRWCPSGSVGPNGVCQISPLVQNEAVLDSNSKAEIIPGVALRATQACSAVGALSDEFGTGITTMTPSTYQLFFGLSGTSKSSGTGTTTVQRQPIAVPTPRISTSLDAWAYVID